MAFSVTVRLALKYLVSGRLIVRWFPDFKAMAGRGGLLLSAQGGMAMAIALDYRLAAQDSLSQLVLTVVAFSVVLNDFLGYLVTLSAMRRSGEARLSAPGETERATDG